MPRGIALAALVALMLVGQGIARAQQDGPAFPAEPTPQALRERIEQVKADTSIQGQTKQVLLETYQKALERTQAAQEWAAKATSYEQERQAAPALIQELREKLEAEPGPLNIEPPDEPVARLQQELVNAQAQAAEKKKLASELEAEQNRRAERRREAPAQSEAARKALEEVNQALAAIPAEGLTPLEAARLTLLRARKKALEGELRAYQEELLSYDARGELLNLKRQLNARELERAQKRVERWQEIVQEKRRKEAEKAARETAREAARAHPALQELARQNKELARLRAETLTPKMEGIAAELQATNQRLSALQDELNKVQERVQAAGMTKELGLRLRKVKAELPDVREHRARLKALQPEIVEAQLKALDFGEQLAETVNGEARLQEIMEGLDPSIGQAEREEIRSAARDLLQTRRELLTALRQDYDSYFDMLDRLARAHRQLISVASRYRAFIGRNILWFRSNSHLAPADLRRAARAARWLAGPQNWKAVGREIASDAAGRPLLYALAFLVFAVLLWVRPRCRAALRRTGERAKDIQTDSVRHTVAAVGLTLLLAALWPWLLCSAGWLLASAGAAGEFTRAVGAGLIAAGMAALTCEAVRAACVEDGLGSVHFRSRTRALQVLRKNLAWLLPIAAPVVFLVILTEWQSVEAHRESLGRLAFLAGQVGLAVFVQRIVRREGGVLQEVLARHEGGWLDRLRVVWYPLAVAVPIALAAAAALGYYYTAQVLTWRLVLSLWLLLALVGAYELMLRWLFVARRKMALEEAQRRREAAEAEEAGEAPPELVGAEFETPEMSIHAIGQQSRQLLGSVFAVALVVMLWAVWRDIVPALSVLGDIALEKDIPITLGNVGMCLLVIVITVIAARNIPGLMEIAVLQRLPLDAAVRFAISRISRYAITIVGIILAFNAVGIGWSKVQWLAAAITVGLGFGLQEIFANFVSGLIILFERPMRVGDTVTVGDVTGTVTKIRIRATTIMDWDRKELVVPNREFITGRLVNWTLSDRILRIIIPVGIAYGSDTRLAEQTLMRVARDNETVLEEPAPNVFFMGFGGSALTFELRVFVPNVESFLKVRHELHMAIDRAFREAGIEIAFPQQDIHVRSIRASLPIVRHAEPEAAPPVEEED